MREIRRVAVLGAGTMGSQIAAHLANAQIPCVLLDRIPSPLPNPGARDSLAQHGLASALKARPAAFFAPENARLISTGNFDDHLERLRECDWIIEAVAEDLGIKRKLLEKVRPFIPAGAIVSSNTSGISLAKIAEDFDQDFRWRWLGTHFFNPPRYMKLLEMIPTRDTLPEVTCRISRFADEVLGKGVVRAKDRPNFIANRIGVFVHLLVLELMQEEGLSIDEVDALTGPAIGLPKSATFRTVDIVGLDVMAHVVRNLYESLPEDERRESFRLPDFMERMIERDLLGEKTGQGFYKRIKRNGTAEVRTLDLSAFEYKPRQTPQFQSLEMTRGFEETRPRVKALFDSQDRAGRFYQKLWKRTFHYAACRIPEISDDLISVDRAMEWGFSWECGPFKLWDAIGVERIACDWQKERAPLPQLVEALLRAGKRSFYADSQGGKVMFDLGRADYVAIEERPGVLMLGTLKSQNREIRRNAGASLVDLGDGVVCLEFHSKMNTIGPDAIQMIHLGLKALDENFDAMVVGNQAQNFSAGANLMLLLLSIQEGEWDEIHEAVRAFQNANMALKYAAKPVVAAPCGLALGGGAETALHCARIVAAAETYLGLVEASVGLIPAGGGSKEMIVRAMNSVPSDENADPFLPLKEVFQNIGMAKVSTSAEEARRFGYLSASDAIVVNRDRQIAMAKQAALDMVLLGHRPGPPREDVLALGEPAFAKMKLALHLMRRAEYISDYDLVVGTKLAKVLSGGGEFTAPQRVSEQYLLDLERDAFVSLCGEERTVDRIQHMLKTGKPLRN